MVRRKCMLKTKSITVIKIRVATTQHDIDEGMCLIPTKCMEVLAVSRALSNQLGLTPDQISRLRVRVNGGHIHFNYDGFRWIADMPAAARNEMIRFDRDKHLAKPHSFTITARQTTKIIPMTDERREQINLARNNRIREGRPDKLYTAPTIRERIVGFAEGY